MDIDFDELRRTDGYWRARKVRRAHRWMVKQSERTERRARRRRRNDNLPLPFGWLVTLAAVVVVGVALVWWLDVRGTLGRHAGLANLLTAFVGGAFGIPTFALVFAKAQQRQQARQWRDYHSVVAVRVAHSALKVAALVARTLDTVQGREGQRWLTSAEADEPDSGRDELVYLLTCLRAGIASFDEPDRRAVTVPRDAIPHVIALAAQLGQQVERSFTMMERTPTYVSVGPVLHRLGDEVTSFEELHKSLWQQPEHSDVPPTNFTTTTPLRVLLASILNACYVIEPTCRREAEADGDYEVRYLIQVNDLGEDAEGLHNDRS